MALLDLPNELLLPIAKELHPSDLRALVLTNRRLANLLMSDLHKSAVTNKKCALAALFWATAIGREAMVRLVLEKGPKIVIDDICTYGANSLNKKLQVMFEGPSKCSDDIVKQVLKKGVFLVVTEGRRTWTCLHWAFENKHKALFRLLLDKGASTEVLVNVSQQTILHLAAWEGDEVSAKLLLRKRSRVDTHTQLLQFGTLQSQRADIGRLDLLGYTPLHLAARAGKVKLVELLLDSGARIDSQIHDTALHLAAKHEHEAVVALLLKRGADPNLKDACGMTPLHLVVLYRFKAVAEMLLLNGADITTRDRHGTTVLHVAAENGDEALTKLLLREGSHVNIDVKNHSGNTPLHLAAKYGHESVVAILLKEGANIQNKNKDGKTAVYLASLWSNKSVEEFLRKHGA
ncbi:uncharacterized protein H6S33_011215 [Morchella sextelata]|uniref:uncharacterized protein n=1 Tax=Morchella sextelata TaxID=1174677 RepID=UPI001D039551|nr:uncharacterized protein H6S33_011215 [Morchella sextelata]KAH0610788.1 hypothetical protein H6S33_011215 [Morchella sextelata]